MPTVTTVVHEDREWDALVTASPRGEIYHTSRWLHLLEEAFGVSAVRLGIRAKGRLVAGIPLLLRRVALLRIVGSPLSNVATPQLGPLAAEPGFDDRLFDAIDAFQRSERIAFAEMIYGVPDSVEPLLARGYRVRPSMTLLLPLGCRDPAELWRGFEGRCRTAIRKANREGVVVEPATRPDFINEYVRMAAAVYGRQRRELPFGERFYRGLWNAFATSGNARTLLARHGGEIIAAAFFLVHRGRLYYQDGVSYPEQNHLCANNLLQWEAIQWGLARGLEVYDMVGSGNPAIARFKASFGGKPMERPHVYRTNTSVAAAALACYPSVSRVSRRLKFLFRRWK